MLVIKNRQFHTVLLGLSPIWLAGWPMKNTTSFNHYGMKYSPVYLAKRPHGFTSYCSISPVTSPTAYPIS